MITIEIKEPGGPEVLELGQRDLPEPNPDEVVIKVKAAGVNGPDLVQRRGHYPPPKGASDLLGLEVSGTISAIGTGVKNLTVGDEVCALTNGGGYAEYVAVNSAHCLPIPGNIALQDAAGLPETYFTVWSNLFYDQPNPEGQNLLVHGGAGGIGSTAIQLGKALGMQVFTTCKGEDADYCKSLGADIAIDFETEDFVEIVRAHKGANLILDIIGGNYVAKNIKAASPDARIVQLAFNAGSKMELNLMPVMLKRLVYTGSTLRSRPESFKSDIARDLAEKVWPLFEQKKLKAQTHKVFNFKDARQAHTMMEAAAHRGKILLTP